MQSLIALSRDVEEIKTTVHAIKQKQVGAIKENWIDGQDIMLALNISKRTLQTLRDNGTLPFSRISGKFYYKVSDIETLLSNHYVSNLKHKKHGK